MSPDHPMLTNIRALADLAVWQRSIDLAEESLSDWLKSPRGFRRIYLVGHGSSLYNGMVGESLLEHIAGVPAKAISAFQFAAYAADRLLGPESLVVGISTTGETESVCQAMERAHRAGAATLGITAYASSALTQTVDQVILTGGEDDRISVKTRSFVQALIPLYRLAARLTGAAEVVRYWDEQIGLAAEDAQVILRDQWEQLKGLAEKHAQAPKVFVLGTGPNLGTAEEASLKVIEMAKLYSECQELEDFFHGRLREVDPASPLFFLAPQGGASRRTLDFLTALDRIGAPSVVLTDQVTPGIQRLATDILPLPAGLDEYATPLLYILPLHIFGYELALQRGYDPNARRYDLVPQKIKYEGDE